MLHERYHSFDGHATSQFYRVIFLPVAAGSHDTRVILLYRRRSVCVCVGTIYVVHLRIYLGRRGRRPTTVPRRRLLNM